MQNDIFSQTNQTTAKRGGERKTFSVEELNRRVKDLLEVHLPLIWVEGEISNFSAPASGHWYFTLKDERAQVRCAMFKGRNQQVKFRPKAGDKVLLRARVSLYEGRGDFQLIAEHMEESGFGLLQQRYEALKAQLLSEGLFNDTDKHPIPSLPNHIGIITSPTGAAVRDVISVLQRRFPSIPITVIPAPVQGDEAPAKLIKAIDLAENSGLFDVLLLCRGGGSIEDLWAFNSEALARRIYECDIPIISAVGHEVDFTIADFVADLRAPTPSAAAELLSPNKDDIQQLLQHFATQLKQRVAQRLQQHKQVVDHLRARLKHPGERLNARAQQLDQLEIRLTRAMQLRLQRDKTTLSNREQRLAQQHPQKLLALYQKELVKLNLQLNKAVALNVEKKTNRLQRAVAMLDIASPLATLKRGYSITTKTDGTVVRTPSDTKTGETITIKLAEGELSAKVN